MGERAHPSASHSLIVWRRSPAARAISDTSAPASNAALAAVTFACWARSVSSARFANASSRVCVAFARWLPDPSSAHTESSSLTVVRTVAASPLLTRSPSCFAARPADAPAVATAVPDERATRLAACAVDTPAVATAVPDERAVRLARSATAPATATAAPARAAVFNDRFPITDDSPPRLGVECGELTP